MIIAHIADMHLRDKDLDESQKCMDHIIEKLLRHSYSPDLIVIAGDVFDSRDIKLDTDACRAAFSIVSDLVAFAPVAIVTGTPLHDGYATQALGHLTGAGHNVIVSDRPETLILEKGWLNRAQEGYIEKPEAVVSMVPTPTKRFWQGTGDIRQTDEEISEQMTAIFAGLGVEASKHPWIPHILVGHFSVRGAQISNGQQMVGRDIEIGRDQIDMAEAALVCLGHIHKAQQIGDNIFYSGSIYRKDFGEMEEKGCYVHEVLGTFGGFQPATSTFIKTPTRQLVKTTIDITEGPIDKWNIHNELTEREGVTLGEGDHVKVELRLWDDQDGSETEAVIKDRLIALRCEDIHVKLIRIPRENVRSERILKLRSLSDKIQEMAKIKGEEVPDGVLSKASTLETHTQAEVLQSVSSGQQQTASFN